MYIGGAGFDTTADVMTAAAGVAASGVVELAMSQDVDGNGG